MMKSIHLAILAILYQTITSYRFYMPRLISQAKLTSSVIKLSNPTYRTTLKEKEIDIYENEIIFDDLGDTEDDLALETFKELSMHTDSLSLQAFLEWEDIKEVLSRGYIDNETMNIIIKEVGIKSGFMSFTEFKDLVDIINQVNAALEQNNYNGMNSKEDDDDSDDNESYEDEDDVEDSELTELVEATESNTLKWLESQMDRMEKNVEEK